MLIARFLALRLAIAVPVVLGIVFVTFMLIRIGHQDPVAMLAGPLADASTLQMIRKELDLDRPVLQQFVTYVGRVAQGDLGRSWQGGAPVLQELVRHFPITLELVVLAVGLAALVGIPVGIRAAMRPNGRFDQVTRFGALTTFSIPTYWMGLMAILVFFYLLRWAPPPMGRISLEVIPPPVVTGSTLVDSLMTGNWAAARSAAAQLVLPVLCFTLLAAASLIEYIVSWGGLGQWGLNAILQGDFAVVQGYVLALALSAVIVFLVVDLAVLLLEPRSHRRT